MSTSDHDIVSKLKNKKKKVKPFYIFEKKKNQKSLNDNKPIYIICL